MSVQFRYIRPQAADKTHFPDFRLEPILQFRHQGIGYDWETIPVVTVPDDKYMAAKAAIRKQAEG